MKGTVFRVNLTIEAEQLSGDDVSWDDLATHVAALASREIQIGNVRPKRFRVKATVDTASDEPLEPSA